MVTAEELGGVRIFSCLDEAERQRLASKAADVRLEAGEWVFREGELPWFFVLLEGELVLSKDVMGREQELHRYKLGEFFGEIPILLGAPTFASVRAVTDARVARFDRQQLHELIRDSAQCSAAILQTMTSRLSAVQQYAAEIPSARVLIVGSQYDTDCREIRTFLAANRIAYEWVDKDREPERVPSCMPRDLTGPAVVVDRQKCLHSPTVREVADALDLQTAPKEDHYDVIVAGAGPAGMAAGVYGASEGLKVLLVERSAAGGQAGTSSRIENYLGFPHGISGDDLSGRALQQARNFGAQIAMTRSIESIYPLGRGYCVSLDGGDRVSADVVVLATGVEWRRLQVEGIDRLHGRGVLYGAGRTEANSVIGKKVYVVGGGNSAGQAAVFFSNYAAEVKVLVRGKGLTLTMSSYLIQQLEQKCNVEVIPYTQVLAAEGDDYLERIAVRQCRPGEKECSDVWDADALFVMIGADANTGWLPSGLQCDEHGYVCTGRDLSHWPLEREPFPLETSLPGIFAVGDVRHGSIKRVSSGVGEGSMSISFIHQYLALAENSGADGLAG